MRSPSGGNCPNFQTEAEWKEANRGDKDAVFHPEDPRHKLVFLHWNFKEFLSYHQVIHCDSVLKGDYPFEVGSVGADNSTAPQVSRRNQLL